MICPALVRSRQPPASLTFASASQAEEGLGPEDEYLATHSATLKVLDGIAESVRDLEPPQVNEYDTANRDSSLPGVVFICNLMSMEFWAGPDSKMGTAVYGVTRLSAPWLIQPEEMFDGAVSQRVSWHFTNNPIVEELISKHGRDLNFLGCIIQRTNWGGQRDMQLSASRSAQMAKMLGADGAIITTTSAAGGLSIRCWVSRRASAPAFERPSLQKKRMMRTGLRRRCWSSRPRWRPS